MKKQSNRMVSRLCMWAGVFLIAAGAFVLISWQGGIRSSEEKAKEYVEIIRSLIPEAQGAVPEERTNNAMPALSLEGTDFIGILEMPRYGSVLPVCADWGQPSRYPCRFDGSVYNGTMQIGATSQKGQYDFYREISVGDTIFFTDMEGNRYAYSVTDLRYEKHADQAALRRRDADLTLFIKNMYSFEYIIVFCGVLR